MTHSSVTSGNMKRRHGALPEDSNSAHRALALHNYFDRVVCINLPSRDDRWQSVCEQLESADWPFRTPQRFAAIDGRICHPPAWMRNRYAECDCAWGCYQSHLRILEEALMGNVEKLLILEDDAVFAPNFCTSIAEFLAHVPNDWDHLFFGGEHILGPTVENEVVCRCRQVHRTHAHAMRGDFIRQAYQMLVSYPTINHYRRRGLDGLGQYLLRAIRRPKSLWSASQAERSAHVDHHFGAMHRTGRFNVFSPRTWLVGQAAGQSDIMQETVAEMFWQ